MAKLPCTICEREFSDAVLLYGDDGRICAECQAGVDEAQETSGRVWSMAAGGPILAFAAVAGAVGGCVPLAGLLFLALAPLFALMGVVAGGRAIHAGITRPQGVGDSEAAVLIASGVLAVVVALPVGLYAAAALMVQLAALLLT